MENAESTNAYSEDTESSDLNFEKTDEGEETRIGLNMSGEPSSFTQVLAADHPLMIKYQSDLKERLLKLHQQTDEQLFDLKKTITAQEKENTAFAREAHDFENELVKQEYKLMKIHEKFQQSMAESKELKEKFKSVEKSFQSIDEKRIVEEKKDVSFQKQLEDLALEVVQLTALQMEVYTDATSLKRTVEKTSRERSNLELMKLRQDLMISRLENDKFKLEDKINLYKSQWAIKKEEVSDLRKELNDANAEMQTINFEKLQIVQQWRQSLSSLEKRDGMLSEMRDSVRSFEDEMRTLELDISGHKKLVRKELERNEQFTLQLKFRESDIAHIQKKLDDVLGREACLQEDLTTMERVTEVTENELAFLSHEKLLKDKELNMKDMQIQKAYTTLKNLENKYMDVLHEKLTITNATKYTERIVHERKKTIDLLGQELAPFEREIAKLKKEIVEAENGQRNQEKEYLHFQRELVFLTKQSSERWKEIDLYRKRIAIMAEKKTRLEAEINKEETEIKNIELKIHAFESDVTRINKHLCERKELQEELKQTTDLTRGDFSKLLKEAELNSLQKKSELDKLMKKKDILFCNLIDAQRDAIVWEGKVHLVEETRKILKGEIHLDEVFGLKSEIRRLQVKLDHIKKEQELLVQEMGKAVARHTNLYVQADKVIMRGNQKKSAKYVATKIDRARRKIHEYKKELDNYKQEIRSKEISESQISNACGDELRYVEDLKMKTSAVKINTNKKQQEKRQAVIRLSFKQKKAKLLQRFKDGTYVRAIRNAAQRSVEAENLFGSLHAIRKIADCLMVEYPHLVPKLTKISDYVTAAESI